MLQLFRIMNLCWAALMASVVLLLLILALPAPPPAAVAGVAFWSFYLVLALGTFFQLRVAWALAIIQLFAIWVLMGIAVSESSFVFLTGQVLATDAPGAISFVVFNSFFGVLVPASALLIILLLARDELAWVMGRRGRLASARR